MSAEQADGTVSPTPPSSEALAVADPEPDQAWKVLSLVNDWIRHAETKLIAILAASGVVGGVLYNLLRGIQDRSTLVTMFAVACATFILIAGARSTYALAPLLRWRRLSEDPVSPLYFRHIVRRYGSNSASYVSRLKALTANRTELTEAIAQQVHANSHVASRKYLAAGWALASLFLALICLALTALAALL